MPALLWGGNRLWWIGPDDRPQPFRFAITERAAIAVVEQGFQDRLPPELLSRLRAPGEGTVRTSDPILAAELRRLGVPMEPLELRAHRTARERLEWPFDREEREFLLALAEERLRRVLGSPQETLISLAREEERVERAMVRESGAWAQWVPAEAGPLALYARDWARFRELFGHHHQDLSRALENAAREVVPNLSQVVGARVAGRLVAAAGGVWPLARMSSSRLQLVGSRRRPGGGRGPRFGVIFRAIGMETVPPDRQGRYARSLAAMAVIAVRSDATTRTPVAPALVLRRDRRLKELLRGRRS
jgi:hypothetical protein